MRRSAALESVWSSGRYIGANRANGYITVNPSWTLAQDHSSGSSVYAWWRVPFRRWADTGSDIEVPRAVIESLDISRDLTSDTAEMTLTIKNADPAGGPNKPAQGTFAIRQYTAANSWLGARSPSSWGAPSGGTGNFSYGAFSPGSLIKTYEGWGGYNLGLSAALASGNVVQSGVWVIDDCDTQSRPGKLVITARDLGQLLTDQVMYPPFMPDGCYPTQFYSETWNSEVNGDPEGFFPTVTNYGDLVEIVELIALWAGFHNPEQTGMLGMLESTGIDFPEPIKADFFDKKHPIDAIKELGKIVGYRAWVNQEGGLHWTSTNTWSMGNTLYSGARTGFLFTLDSKVNAKDVGARWSKAADRSELIVSQGNPELVAGVKHAAYDTDAGPQYNLLHGMAAPAMYQLDHDIELNEMSRMAELMHIRMWFARNRTNVEAVANPLIDVDDQVRVLDRATWQYYTYRVVSMSTTHNWDTGVYDMNVGTTWCGPAAENWSVTDTGDGHLIYEGTG